MNGNGGSFRREVHRNGSNRGDDPAWSTFTVCELENPWFIIGKSTINDW